MLSERGASRLCGVRCCCTGEDACLCTNVIVDSKRECCLVQLRSELEVDEVSEWKVQIVQRAEERIA